MTAVRFVSAVKRCMQGDYCVVFGLWSALGWFLSGYPGNWGSAWAAPLFVEVTSWTPVKYKTKKNVTSCSWRITVSFRSQRWALKFKLNLMNCDASIAKNSFLLKVCMPVPGDTVSLLQVLFNISFHHMTLITVTEVQSASFGEQSFADGKCDLSDPWRREGKC